MPELASSHLAPQKMTSDVTGDCHKCAGRVSSRRECELRQRRQIHRKYMKLEKSYYRVQIQIGYNICLWDPIFVRQARGANHQTNPRERAGATGTRIESLNESMKP
ncbi:hypothetical protein EVAR_87822_1 [Eumeta japonica]|uniref:Uncharacterized protein n=1 Tax=Eumeta variegata TaxID=151549 RepID=A0A4C1Z7J7_EUMVA|nr:hypothetical protein EVAR_87822_1 [Eumeta japonica]